MISFKTILTEEEVNLYKGDIILKNKRAISQKDIFNQLRALPNVIVVTPIQDSYLNSQKSDKEEYALVKIKFINTGDPKGDLDKIRNKAMTGGEDYKRINGLLQFIIRPNTIIQVNR